MKDNTFLEPIPIKAGSDLLRLGIPREPPKVDCRIISEDNYQKLKTVFYSNRELLEALTIIKDIANEHCNNFDAYNDVVYLTASKAIQKATK